MKIWCHFPRGKQEPAVLAAEVRGAVAFFAPGSLPRTVLKAAVNIAVLAYLERRARVRRRKRRR